MYEVKNYMIALQSHWGINQPTFKAAKDSIPEIIEYASNGAKTKMPPTSLRKMAKRIFPDVFSFPLLRRQYCKMLMEEINHMKKEINFTVNEEENLERQIPEIVLAEHCPDLYSHFDIVVKTIINPMIICLWQRNASDIATIQIANYNLREKEQGAFHHDVDADVSVVVPLNTGDYKGGGTEFHNHGKIKPIPTGHALVFPSFNQFHRGLPIVGEGDRYLLVFWLYDRSRIEKLFHGS